jgi:cellulose biosynthesis protein BcsQ
MAVIAVYSMKGGVGKSTTAVNLAWASAVQSSRSTLVWDLDPQGASSFILDARVRKKDQAQAMLAGEIPVEKRIQSSAYPKLDLLAADISLRGLDRFFFQINRRKHMAKFLLPLRDQYERIVLDCAPGLSETSEQVLRAADLVIVPVIPSALAERALAEVQQFLDASGKKHAPLLPVFNMVDRRRKLHREYLAQHPQWPVIPMSSDVEKMTDRNLPLGAFAPRCAAHQAFSLLWRGIEKRLMAKI